MGWERSNERSNERASEIGGRGDVGARVGGRRECVVVAAGWKHWNIFCPKSMTYWLTSVGLCPNRVTYWLTCPICVTYWLTCPKSVTYWLTLCPKSVTYWLTVKSVTYGRTDIRSDHEGWGLELLCATKNEDDHDIYHIENLLVYSVVTMVVASLNNYLSVLWLVSQNSKFSLNIFVKNPKYLFRIYVHQH